MRRLRLKCLLGLALAAALVTLLSPYPFTVHHITLQEVHTTPHTPTQRLSLPETTVGTKIDTEEEGGKEGTERTSNKTSHIHLTKSPAEVRVEEKVKDVQVKQEELPVSYEASVQNPPPEEWVEVKKTKPKVLQKGNGGRRVKGHLKNVAKPLKILGHSPKELQERALTFPESSPLRAFLKEQTRRVAHVSSTCRSFQPSLTEVVAGSRGPPVGLLSIRHIIYDKINQLTFCPVYKAASTSWTVILLQLAGHWTQKTSKLPVQKAVKMYYPRISGLGAVSITAGTTHFMVVRHPLERLLSCYLDKFENASKDYYYHTFGEKIVKRYRKALYGLHSEKVMALQQEVRLAMKKGGPVNLPNNPFANPLGPTFPEFVEHVVITKYDDEHWRTYATHCAPCTLTYDFVLRFESLQEENKWFLEYLNRTGEVTPRWDNHNPSGDTKKLSCDYYGQLSLRQIEKLVAKYTKDMLLYEYDAEDYRKCAKDYVELTTKKGVLNSTSATTTTTSTTTTTTTAGAGSGGGGGAS